MNSALARCFTRDVLRSELHQLGRSLRRIESRLDGRQTRRLSYRKVTLAAGVGVAAFVWLERERRMAPLVEFSRQCARRAEMVTTAYARRTLSNLSKDSTVQKTLRDVIFNAFNTEEGISQASEFLGTVIQTPEVVDYAAGTMESSFAHPRVTDEVYRLARKAARDVLSDAETLKATQSHVDKVLKDPRLAETASKSLANIARRWAVAWLPPWGAKETKDV